MIAEPHELTFKKHLLHILLSRDRLRDSASFPRRDKDTCLLSCHVRTIVQTKAIQLYEGRGHGFES